MAGQGVDDEHALVRAAVAVSEFLDALTAAEEGDALNDPRRGLALKALYEIHLDYSIANEYAAGVPERDKPESDVAVHHLDVASPPELERLFQSAARSTS
jgi:hypothetical protein